MFASDDLLAQGRDLKKTYQSAQPFPHIVIDNFLAQAVLEKALDAFPTPESLDFYQYNNPLEKKLAFDQIDYLPLPIQLILQQFNSPTMLRFLEEMTGIDGLIPDPYYRGGGIHQIQQGGKLDVHIDFNKYTKLNLDRRLNAILYLNQDWQEAYGGHFELWRGHKDEDGKHILEECVERVLPVFNRLAVFSTSEKSYHGHPEPLTCPEGWSRKSLAVYYYTNGRPAEESVAPHSTTFIKRPADPEDPEVARLREQRNTGRLASNVKSDLLAD